MPEGGFARRFAVNTLYGVGGRVVQICVGVFLIAYVVRKLGMQEWGLVVLATTVVNFLLLIQGSVAAGIAKKLTTYITRGEVAPFRAHYTAAMLLAASLAAAVFLVALGAITVFWPYLRISADLAHEARLIFIAIGVSSACTALSFPLVAALQAVHRLDINDKLQAAGLILRCILVVGAFELWHARASTYGYVLIVCNAAVLLALWARVHQLVQEARLAVGLLSRALMRDVLVFNTLNLLNNTAFVLFLQAPTVVLQGTGFGLATTGLYGIGLQLNTLMRACLLPVSAAAQPVIVSLESLGRHDRLRQIFRIITKAHGSVGLMMWVWFFLLGDVFLRLWLHREADELAPLVRSLPWLIGACAVGVLAMPSGVTALALERMWVPAMSGMGLVALMIATTFLALAPSRPDSALVTVGIVLAVFLSAHQLILLVIVARDLKLLCVGAMTDILLRPVIPAAGGGLVVWAFVATGYAHTVVQLATLTVLAGGVFLALAYVALFGSAERELLWTLAGRARRPEAGT